MSLSRLKTLLEKLETISNVESVFNIVELVSTLKEVDIEVDKIAQERHPRWQCASILEINETRASIIKEASEG